MDEQAMQAQAAAPAEEQAPAQAAKQTAKKKNPNVNYYVRIIGTLFVITAIVAILLSLVNMVTKPIIDRLAEEKRIAALAEVMPDAEYQTITQLPEGIDGLVAMTQANQNGAVVGYCVQVTSNGFGGAMELMVGVDNTGAVTGVNILSNAETLNTNRHGWLVEQYKGHSGEVLVSKTQADATHIQAISGATVTSNGVTRGVNTALRAVSAYLEGGVS